MAAALTPLDAIDSVNPATCEVLARFARTALSSVPAVVGNAREAQRKWAAQPIRHRSALLRSLRATLLARRGELAEAVVLETGKPRVEALFADVFVALDSAEYCARAAAPLLRPERVPHHSSREGQIRTPRLRAARSAWHYRFLELSARHSSQPDY